MQKKRVIPLLLAGIFAAASVIGGSAPPVMAEGEGNLIDTTRKCSVTLRYFDDPESGESGKGESGKVPVVGAEFTLYKIADIHDRIRIHLAEGDDALPVAEKPAEVTPAEETSADGTATDAVPAEDAQAADGVQAEGTDAAATDAAAADTAATDTAATDTAATDTATADTAAADTASSETQPADDGVIARDFHTGNGYISIIEGIQVYDGVTVDDAYVDTVQKAYGGAVDGGASYKAVTDASGLAAFTGMDQGVYLAVETKAAKEHYESAPFLISVPITSDDGTVWVYDRDAYPKPLPAGDLIISKTVGGNAGEKNKEFHFTVAFEYSGIYKESHPTTYHYTKSDKKEGQMKESDVIVLKDGESITIDTIPAGTKYKVTEKEANADGYKTTVKDESKNSTIMRTVQSKVMFTNTKDVAAKAGGAAGGGSAGTGRVQTGDLVMPIILAGGGILAAVIILVAVLRKRKGGNA